MSLFDKLNFKAELFRFGLIYRARIDFDNGYGASVRKGIGTDTDEKHPYELHILKGDYICHTTPISMDAIGYCTKDDIEKLLHRIKELPKEVK